jgi:hypothetical protein
MEPGRSAFSVAKRNLDEEVFEYKGSIFPRFREARLSAPFNPLA